MDLFNQGQDFSERYEEFTGDFDNWKSNLILSVGQ